MMVSPVRFRFFIVRLIAAGMLAASFPFSMASAQEGSVQLFPQLLFAQDSPNAPKLGKPIRGSLATKVKRIASKKYVFEINPVAQKPITIAPSQTARVNFNKEVRMEIENVNGRQLHVTIIDGNTLKVLKKQTVQSSIKTNLILGSKAEPRLVIALTKGSQRPR